jgi:hypothetical protein
VMLRRLLISCCLAMKWDALLWSLSAVSLWDLCVFTALELLIFNRFGVGFGLIWPDDCLVVDAVHFDAPVVC